ncbi:putative membrane spanning export protein [Actinobacillus equuli]|nr:putative membrane spanning export protein [Actinobacillus equuli]
MSEVELLRTKRQSADLAQQIAERKNRYAAEANEELVRTESELAQAKETLAMYADPVERSQIKAPLRGIVKNIKINTVGGVVQAGQDILEIVPLDENCWYKLILALKTLLLSETGKLLWLKLVPMTMQFMADLKAK